MPVRTMVKSLDETLAVANASDAPQDQDKANTSNSKRSQEEAQKATERFTSAEHVPLASHRPSKTSQGITFAAQDKLPKLPIPDLEQSCTKYIESLEPLQTGREHEETVAAVQDFLKSEGPELQERLKKYAGGKSSYIEQFWYDSYLNYDNRE
jgi:carnitine O-acetyltransferase